MDSIWQPFILSLQVAFCTSLIVLIIGVPIAYCIARCRFPGKSIIEAILTLPLVLPPTILGYYLLILIGRQGFFGKWLFETFHITLVFTWQGAVLAACVTSFPLLLKTAKVAFAQVDNRLEDVARTLGANEMEVFFGISLPLAFRGILAGTLLTFARSMGEFGATLMVAGNLPGRTQTLSVAIYSAVQAGKDQEAAFLVVITTVVCMLIMVGTMNILEKEELQ